MKIIGSKKPSTTTEFIFSEFLSNKNENVLESINEYRRVANIYERVQIALGRKVAYRSTNSTADKVKVNLHVIRATNKI
jgi:hypothetical protein